MALPECSHHFEVHKKTLQVALQGFKILVIPLGFEPRTTTLKV